MNEFNIDEAKKEYISNIKRYMSETGSLFPHISVFGYERNELKKTIIHVPIPGEYISSSDKKDEFVDEILPAIVKEINKKFVTQAVGWASEAWMTVIDDKTNTIGKQKKEVLFITISSEHGEEVQVYDINRTGKQVNAEGELVDIIELQENLQGFDKSNNPMKGRFADLYRKFKDIGD